MEIDCAIKAAVLREWLKRIDVVRDEFKLVVSETGFYMKAIDPARVMMLETTLDRNAFETFLFKTEGSHEAIYIDTGHFDSIWRNLPPTGLIHIVYPFREGVEKTGGAQEIREYLYIEYSGIERLVEIYPQELVEMGDADFKIPNLTFKNKVTIPISEILKIAQEIKVKSDHLRIKCRKTGIVIDKCSCNSDTRVKIRKFFKSETLEGYYYAEDTSSIFSMDYLVKLIKSLSKTTPILELDQDFPMRIRWDQTFGQDIVGHGMFILAPRIEND